MMHGSEAFGRELCRMLGLDPEDVRKLNVEVEVGKPVRIAVWSVKHVALEEEHSRQRYTVTPIETPA